MYMGYYLRTYLSVVHTYLYKTCRYTKVIEKKKTDRLEFFTVAV